MVAAEAGIDDKASGLPWPLQISWLELSAASRRWYGSSSFPNPHRKLGPCPQPFPHLALHSQCPCSMTQHLPCTWGCPHHSVSGQYSSVRCQTLPCHSLLNVFAWRLNKTGHHFPLSSVQEQHLQRELRVVSLTHIKINGVCSSGGITTHSSGQAGFTIVRWRGNLIRNNSLVFGSIKTLYSNLNFRPTHCLVCLLL